MKNLIIAVISIICSLSVCYGNYDKKSLYNQLTQDTDIMSILNHFTLLVNPDSIPRVGNKEVLIHVLLSNKNKYSEYDICHIDACRLDMRYFGATIIGETIINDYRIIVHSRDKRLTKLFQAIVPLKPSDYTVDDNYIYENYLEHDMIYDPRLYSIEYRIDKCFVLHYHLIMARSPSELAEWGIDISNRLKAMGKTEHRGAI